MTPKMNGKPVVKGHVKNILAKLDASDRKHAITHWPQAPDDRLVTPSKEVPAKKGYLGFTTWLLSF